MSAVGSPRTPERPMAFAAAELSRGSVWACRLFAVALPFLRVPGVRGVTRDLLDQIADVRP